MVRALVRVGWCLVALAACGDGAPLETSAQRKDSLFNAFADDFETGTVLTSDAPAGKWDARFVANGANAIVASAAAAHRGGFGLRVTDGRNTGGGGPEVNVYRDFPASGGDFHARFWVRLATTNGLGGAWHLEHRQASTNYLVQLSSNVATNQVTMMGDTATGTTADPTQLGFMDGGWHLVEVATLGVGTTTGTRRLWVDGALRSSGAANYQGFTISGENLGEPNSDDRRFVGAIDYDDYRSGGAPFASHFGIAASPEIQRGTCTPVTVSLRDSASNAPAPAPYLVAANVTVSGPGTVYSASDCTNPVTSVPIPLSATQASVYFGSLTAGVGTLTVSHLDFLSATVLIGIDAGPPDAGAADAGAPDAGPPDAGPQDAGVPDAGPPDAGAPDSGAFDAGVSDAGPSDGGPVPPDAGSNDGGSMGSDGGVRAPLHLQVACGCGASGGLMPLGLALLLRRRRR